MAYKIGMCPQCSTQIMVQDIMGHWNTFKINYRQADLIFADGHKVRTIICKDCLANPDLKKLFESIVAEDSTASSRPILDQIKTRGEPIGIVERRR